MLRDPFAGKNLPEVSVAETIAARDEGTHQIVDVRELDEWIAVRMPDSVHIPLGELARRANELDPHRPTITVCKSGQRSLYAVEILRAAGFGEVASLNGGLLAWYEAGQPLER